MTLTKATHCPIRPSNWKLRDAKARFGEGPQHARAEGPQRVTVRGRDAVIVIAADELDLLFPPARGELPFLPFMESLTVDGLDLTRAPDVGRDVEP